MKNYLECVHEAAIEPNDEWFMDWLKEELNTKQLNQLQRAADIYASQSNSHKHSVSGSSPNDEEMMRLFESITEEDLDKAIQKYKGLRSASGAVDTKPAREICIKGGERLENGECNKCKLLWGKCCAELL